jgi:hypothetical protein
MLGLVVPSTTSSDPALEGVGLRELTLLADFCGVGGITLVEGVIWLDDVVDELGSSLSSGGGSTNEGRGGRSSSSGGGSLNEGLVGKTSNSGGGSLKKGLEEQPQSDGGGGMGLADVRGGMA